jgi:hypothetical protein
MDQVFDATVNLRVKSFIMGFFGIAAMICFSLGYKKSFGAMLGIVCLCFVSILVNRTRYVRYVDAVLTIIMTVIISGLFLHGRELAPMSFFFVLIMAVAGLLILGTRLGSFLAVYYNRYSHFSNYFYTHHYIYFYYYICNCNSFYKPLYSPPI